MKKKKEVWSLEKVIDPHSTMPEDVKNAFFELLRDHDYHNGSYHYWNVCGDIKEYTDDSDDDDTSSSVAMYKLVDDWLLANGLKENETVMICYWW
jgi:hypothetical protein